MNTTATPEHDHHEHEFLPTIRLTRRQAIGALGGLSAALLAACASEAVPTATTATTASSATTAAASSATTATAATTAATATALQWLTPPTETGGPFPADGSNQNGAGGKADVMHMDGAFRTNMTGDVDGSNVQPGIPLTLKIKIGKKADQSAYANAAVYVWHCNVGGHYSAYSGNMNGGDFSARSFLRAVGVTDANGDVSFTSILPGRYQGRASHIHFAVFADKTLAKRLLTSQFAFDDAEADALYKSNSAYASSLNNPTYVKNDNVFSDGVTNQMLDLSGTTAAEAAINILV